jgi:hypothetical protein
MKLLATNIIVWQAVRSRITWGLSVLPIGLMFAAFWPVFLVASWMDNIQHPGPGSVEVHANGWMWLVSFLSMILALMLAGYTLGWVLNATIAKYLLGWPGTKVRAVFLQSEIPNEWRRLDGGEVRGPVPGRRSWATTRQRGWRHFVLVRGVLGWGGFVFVATTLPSILTHRPGHSWELILVRAVLWAIGGAGFGLAVWCLMEWLFKRQSKADLS